MKRKIVTELTYLKQLSSVVKTQSEVDKIVQDLQDTLQEFSKKALGLAAVQIGILKQVALITLPDKQYVLINPIIRTKEDKVTFKEGCLSLRGIQVVTSRYNNITVEHGLRDSRQTLEAEGLEAIVLQHEIGHMFGKTILDCKHRARG